MLSCPARAQGRSQDAKFYVCRVLLCGRRRCLSNREPGGLMDSGGAWREIGSGCQECQDTSSLSAECWSEDSMLVFTVAENEIISNVWS